MFLENNHLKYLATLPPLFYIGCYIDNSTLRDLNLTSYSIGLNTQHSCTIFCRNYNASYVGIVG